MFLAWLREHDDHEEFRRIFSCLNECVLSVLDDGIASFI